MPNVPVISTEELDRAVNALDVPVRRVQELEVELLSGPNGTMVLKLWSPAQDYGHKQMGAANYLLSLPAANLLRRKLRETVKAHLRSAAPPERE